jgi:hypothetical protein
MNRTIAQHLASPNVSLDEHVRQCQIALARKLEHKKAIYLDLNFWIIVSDAAIGARTNPLELELLGLLRELVAGGMAFCPISDSTFAEVFKQQENRTRNATANLVDELSKGVALIPFETRIATELAHFIHSHGTSDRVYPLDQLVWTKLSHVLGYVPPSNTGYDGETELAIQKAFFDHMWAISFSEIANRVGNSMPLDRRSYDALAERLNVGNAEHAEELRSFAHTYSVEIAGVVDVSAEMAVEIVNEMASKATGASMLRGSEEWLVYERQWKNLLVAAFRKEPAKNALRTMHTYACLHAYVRWNNGHQLEANHFYDFRHAAAALPYCDVFLTERQLRDMVTAKHTGLDKRYGCRVISQLDEAVDYLREARNLSPPHS